MALLWEWEEASHGRRQLTWSTGRRDLRAFAGLGREATDEEIAAEELDGQDAVALPGDFRGRRSAGRGSRPSFCRLRTRADWQG